MSAPRLDAASKNRLETLIALARLLERLERAPSSASAEQYRTVVQQLQSALGEALPAEALDAVFNAYPAAGTVYENMHYERAGLSRSPLERSVASEMAASQAIARIAAGARAGGAKPATE